MLIYSKLTLGVNMSEILGNDYQNNNVPEIYFSESIPEYKREVLQKLAEVVNRNKPELVEEIHAFIEAQNKDADIEISYDSNTEHTIDSDSIVLSLIDEMRGIKNKPLNQESESINNNLEEKRKTIARKIRLRGFEIYLELSQNYKNFENIQDYPSAS